MAYDTNRLNDTASISLKGGWITSIISWFREWREKHAKCQAIRCLLSYDRRILKDVGLSRSKLVEELGYDPCELPFLHNTGAYPNPYLRIKPDISSNHTGRYEIYHRR